MRTLQFKRGEKANLPTLAAGEPGWTTDEKRLYVGTGSENVALPTKADVDGKAATSHTHTKSQITDFPSSLKNPAALTFTGAATGSYDGSVAKNVNIPAYSNMTAATADAAGKAGLVPAPAAGAQGKFLRGDGTWQTPPNTTYGAATTSAAGLMSAADKTKLDGIAAGATQNTGYRYTATIPTTGWSSSAPYKLTLTVSGITAAMTPTVDVVQSSDAAAAALQLEAWGCVSRITTDANSITVYCYDSIPETAIPIQLVGVV